MSGPHLADLPDGRFVLTDPVQSRVLLFDPETLRFGRLVPPVAFLRPVGVDVKTANGGFYMAVADAGSCQVSLFGFYTEDSQ